MTYIQTLESIGSGAAAFLVQNTTADEGTVLRVLRDCTKQSLIQRQFMRMAALEVSDNAVLGFFPVHRVHMKGRKTDALAPVISVSDGMIVCLSGGASDRGQLFDL